MGPARVLFLVVLLSVAVSTGARAADFVGPAVARDGDDLVIGGVRLRLFGIDAPELNQICSDASGPDWRCGQWAKSELEELIAGQHVTCRQRDHDRRHDRPVVVCDAGGRDLNAEMVRRGGAFAYRRYSDTYVLQENQARSARRGVWRGNVLAPEAYRAAWRDVGSQPADAQDGACRIKGNVSSGGERIYHMPGQRDYARTRIAPEQGERWFCSPQQAREAGWRAARR